MIYRLADAVTSVLQLGRHASISPILSQRYPTLLKLVHAYTIHSFVHMNAQNMLFRLVCSWTVHLALVTVHMLGYLCDNIGLILACLPSGSTDVTASASRYITKPSGIPILSPVLFMHVGDPYIPPF